MTRQELLDDNPLVMLRKVAEIDLLDVELRSEIAFRCSTGRLVQSSWELLVGRDATNAFLAILALRRVPGHS